MAVQGDRLLICDQGRPDVVVVDRWTGKVKLWGEIDRRPRCPVDVAVDDVGHVYVADADAGAVLHYDDEARFVEQIALPPAGTAMARPVAVCCDEAVLYVGDVEARQVHRWSRAQRDWLPPLGPLLPGDMPLQAPTGLAVAPDGRLLIVDALQRHLLRIDVENDEIGSVAVIGRAGRGAGEFVRPKQVCVMADGRMLVSDAGRQSILIFAPDGGYLAEIHDTNVWSGWTLPAGVLVTDWGAGTELAGQSTGDQLGGTWLVVSDALGLPSLTLVVLPDAD
jgi:sugar lactone lactonase YvrE